MSLEKALNVLTNNTPYYSVDVHKFKDKFNLFCENSSVSVKHYKFRKSLLIEEIQELITAFKTDNVEEVYDALIDIVFVALGNIFQNSRDHSATSNRYLSTQISNRVSKDIFNLNFNCDKLMSIFKDELNNLKSGNSIIGKSNLDEILDLIRLVYVFFLKYTKEKHYLSKYDSIKLVNLWEYLWNDVVHANMSKVRTSSSNVGSRNEVTYDVTKPKDWQGPKTKKILADFFGTVISNENLIENPKCKQVSYYENKLYYRGTVIVKKDFLYTDEYSILLKSFNPVKMREISPDYDHVEILGYSEQFEFNPQSNLVCYIPKLNYGMTDAGFYTFTRDK